MAAVKFKEHNPFDVYFNQLATQMVDGDESVTDDNNCSNLTEQLNTKSKKVDMDLDVLSKDENDALPIKVTKVSLLAVYTANIDLSNDDNVDNGKAKRGKKVELKPECGKLTDGINDAITDDKASDMYDDIVKQLGLDQEQPVDVPDHLNPFKLGYLKATPPSRFRRMMRSIRDAFTRPLCRCLRSSNSEDDAEV